MKKNSSPYHGFRFSAAVISCAVRWYHRFNLGLRHIEELRRASAHWMRYMHALLALARGTESIMMRDNLRHAPISTMSTYLHSDEA